jgi:integrase
VYELCEKYDYNFPKITRREVNRYIKEALCKLADDMPSLNEWVTTRLSLLEVQKEKRYQAMRERALKGEKLHGEELKTYNKMNAYADSHGSGEMLFKRDFSGEVIRQRWEMVSSHTSRRSAVTSLYDSGLYDVRDMMSISGHTTQKNFEQYIKRDVIHQAERIAEKFKAAKVVNMKRKEA